MLSFHKGPTTPMRYPLKTHTFGYVFAYHPHYRQTIENADENGDFRKRFIKSGDF